MSDATTGVPAANASVSTMPNDSPPSDGAPARRRRAAPRAWRRRRRGRARSRRRRRPAAARSPRRSTPTIVSSAGTAPRSASKARSSTGRPLRSTAWPTNDDPQRLAGLARGAARARRPRAARRRWARPGSGRRRSAGPSRRRPRRPRCAALSRLSLRRAPEQRGDLVRRDRLRVAVERADQRGVEAASARPSRRRARRARAHARRRARRRAARGAAWRPRSACRRGSRRRRWTASRSCRPSGHEPLGRAARAAGARRGAAARRGARVVVERARTRGPHGPAATSSAASASMCRVTPPGYVHE